MEDEKLKVEDMYSKRKQRKIIRRVLDATRKGYCEWTLQQNMFNSDTRWNMEYINESDKISFQIDVDTKPSGRFKSGTFHHLWVFCDDLKGEYPGRLLMSGYQLGMESELKELKKIIHEDFVIPILPEAPDQRVLDKILNKFNLGYTRERKINELTKKKNPWKFWK